MARRRWLVAYDIRDDRRLRQVNDVVRSFGTRMQYSVFLCDLTPIEKIALMAELRDVISLRVDSVVMVDLGVPGTPAGARIEFMGTSLSLPTGGPTIV